MVNLFYFRPMKPFYFTLVLSLFLGIYSYGQSQKVVGYTDLSYNILLNTPGDTLRTSIEGGGSIKWSTGFMRPFSKGKFYVAPGLFLNLTDLRFQKPTYLSVDRDSLSVVFIDDATRKFAKTKVQTMALQVPLVAGVRFSNVFFEVGGFGSLVFFSRQKHKYTQAFPDNKEARVVALYNGKDYTGVRPFQYGVMARLFYKNIGVFAQYYLNSFFETKNYTQPQLLQVGICFNNRKTQEE